MRAKFLYSDLTEKIIACAIAVHRELGPGFLEKIYEEALCFELDAQGLRFRRQTVIEVRYKNRNCGFHRTDLIVEDKVIVELKTSRNFEEIHFAVLLSYMKASKLPVALLFNFALPKLAIRRFGDQFFLTGRPGNQEKEEKYFKG